MRLWLSPVVIAMALCTAQSARADEITVVAPGGMRCSLNKLAAGFEATTGHKYKATVGSGGGTHQQVVKGDFFDVPIVQAPYADVINSGNVVKASETPLAVVPLVVVIKKGSPKPDISTADAVKKLLLGAKGINYPNSAGEATGGAAGISFDKTQRDMGIYDQMRPKVKVTKGMSLMKQVTSGDIDFAISYPSEVNDPDVEIVGPLPRSISTPTELVAFQHAQTKSPAAVKAFLAYFTGPEAAVAYKACGMTPGK